MFLKIGQLVLIFLDILEINLTVDLVGHSEQLKLLTIEDVLPDNLTPKDNYFPQLILVDVVDSSLVSHKDAMEVK